jgi:hypothetical protein
MTVTAVRVLWSRHAPPATRDLAPSVPNRCADSDDVHRAINPVRDRNSTAAHTLHLNRNIQEAIAIKIAECE